MMTQLTRNWWSLVWRGLALMLFSLVALVWPVVTLTALRLLFGACALTDGCIIVTQLARHKLHHGWRLRLWGLASIALGGLLGLWASVTAPVLVAIIATGTILARVFKTGVVNGGASKWTSVWNAVIKPKMLHTR